MTSKERVLTAFANREADRVPIINSNGFLRGMEQTLVDLITEDPAGMLLARRRTEINQTPVSADTLAVSGSGTLGSGDGVHVPGKLCG